MSNKIWHYTVGDDQFGPVSNEELHKLAAAGKISPADQLWKEGLDDWMSARDMSGLFPANPAGAPNRKEVASDSLPGPRTGKKQTMLKSFDPITYIQPFGQAFLLVGFLLVILSRGCDSVGSRYVARAQAKYASAQSDFNNDTELDRQKLQDKIDDADPGDKRDKYREDMKELLEDQTKDRKKLAKGAWRDLEITARGAKNNNAMSGYWHELFFVFGTLLLVVGLTTVGLRGQGSERTICLVMLAIITVSIYVVGSPWVGSLKGLLVP